MATNKIVVGLDNRVQSGDQSQAEIVAALAAAGVSNGIAEQIRDPITGKLIQVTLTFPDTANQQAIDAVNANRGVATATPPLPPPKFVLLLNSISSTVILKGINATTNHRQFIELAMADSGTIVGVSTTSALGVLHGDGVVNTFFLGGGTGLNPFPATHNHAFLTLLQGSPTGSLTFANGSISIASDGGAPIPIVLTNPIVLPAAHASFDSREVRQFYMDSASKLYLMRSFTVASGVFTDHTGGFRTYAQAVAAGAV